MYIIKLGSVTNAQRARKILSLRGYKPVLTRLMNPKKGEGCGYVIKVNTNDIDSAVSVLKDSGLYIYGVERE